MKLPVKFKLILAFACGLAGCAQLPARQPPEPMVVKPDMQKSLDTITDGPAFERTDWSSHTWWNTFNDKFLDRLVDSAMRDNPTLVSAQTRIEQAKQAKHLIELESGINYNSDGSAVRQHLSANGLFPPPLGGSTLNEGDISVGVSYTFDWWGKNRALLQSALGEKRAAEAERGATELALAGEIADAYFSWQDITARLHLAAQIVEKRRAALHLMESRLKRGIDSASATRQTEGVLAQEQDNLKDLESQSQILRDRLAALTGNGPDWGAKLEEPALSPAHPFPLPQKLPLDWLARRPDLIALKWQAEAAANRIEVAKANFYPNVDIRLLLGLQSLDLSKWLGTKSDYASLGPAVHIPLFNGNSLRTTLGVRESDYSRAVAQYNQTLLTAANQVADALVHVSSLEARERLQHDATLVSERSKHLQMERFGSGLTDRLPLLNEEIAALAQQSRESKLQADRKRAMAALFMALGGGYESSQE